MTHLPPLSRREREVTHIIHGLGRATAAQIQERMVEPPSYSAVRAVLRVLVEKGHLVSEYDGPRLVYSPTIPVERARRSVMRHVLRTVFDGSVEGAVTTLLELQDTRLSADIRARLKELIDQASAEGR
ncbi:MAG: BlaI/MecI/CopY family transcriptional regulator [Gemmatimonadota bacterium]|nr:BlaI/MecI/CopY family transcriptional regulator [Gemmatimonadota bacterium]